MYDNPEKLLFIISSLMKRVFEEYAEVNWSVRLSLTKTKF